MKQKEILLKLQKLINEKSPLIIEKELKSIATKTKITLKTLKEELDLLKEKVRLEQLEEAQKEAKEFLKKIEDCRIFVDTKDFLKCKHADCLSVLEYWIAHYNSFKRILWKEKFLDLKDQKITVKLINESYEENEIKSVISTYFDKSDLAQQMWEVRPYFYDSSKLWWVWSLEEYKWEIMDETDILNMVAGYSNANTVQSKEKVEIIESMKQHGRKRKPKEIEKTWIQFKDKLIDYKTGKEFNATPEYFVTNPIPWELSEFEETPKMDKIFEEWVGKDYVKTLYEILAYSLIPDYPLHRLFCFIGSGMNGKSKFLELLRRFIGEDNVASTELDTLIASRFEITRLHKKLVCQMGETNFNELSKTSIIKKLTGQDTIGFEYKNKNPFQDYNYAKILIATNNLPTTTDKTVGFYRRWLIIDFPNEFSEQKDILSDIPEEEYNYLASKCVAVLKELLEKREFHNEGDIEQRKKRYEDRSDFLQTFIDLFTEESFGSHIIKGDFKRKLDSWCKERGHRYMADNTLGKKMKEKEIETVRKTFEWMHDGKGGQLAVWDNIRWKE